MDRTILVVVGRVEVVVASASANSNMCVSAFISGWLTSARPQPGNLPQIEAVTHNQKAGFGNTQVISIKAKTIIYPLLKVPTQEPPPISPLFSGLPTTSGKVSLQSTTETVFALLTDASSLSVGVCRYYSFCSAMHLSCLQCLIYYRFNF
ncbi:unnamed protein product [Leuciscus chuanchicus]